MTYLLPPGVYFVCGVKCFVCYFSSWLFFFSFNNWRPSFLLILFCPPKLLSFTVFLTSYWTIGPYSNQGLNLATLSSSGRLWSTSPAELAALDLKAHLDVPLNCNILHGRQDCIRLPFVFFWLVTFIRIKLSSTREYTGKPATTTQNKENTKTRKSPKVEAPAIANDQSPRMWLVTCP